MTAILLQNAKAILLRNATKVYYKIRWAFYNKMRQMFYKQRQLLQNVTVSSQIATVIQMLCILQNASAQCFFQQKEFTYHHFSYIINKPF